MSWFPWNRGERPQSKRGRPRIVVLIQAKPANYVEEHPAQTTWSEVKHSSSFAKRTSSFAKQRPSQHKMEGDEEKESGALLRTASASSAMTLSAKDTSSIVVHDEAISYEIGRSTFSTQDADRMRSQIARSTFSPQDADRMRSQLDQIQRQLKELSSHLKDLSSTKNSASTATNYSDASLYQT
jgi:hypothetical protein